MSRPGVAPPAYREPEFLPWDGRRVPITFVGGYLGAGKTTAINSMLAQADRPIAVIVNDVGSINIDAALVRRRHGDTIELTNGCVCCTSVDGIGAAFDQIRRRQTPPDHVIVELSGVSDPRRMTSWGQSAGFSLDGIIVVVAADQLAAGALPSWVQSHMTDHITAADLLILTKTDLVEPSKAAATRARLAELAPSTPVFAGGRDAVDPASVGRFLALGGRRSRDPAAVADANLFDAHEVQLLAMPVGMTSTELHDWLRHLLVDSAESARQVVRAKGIARTNDLGLALIQVVGTRVEITSLPAPERQLPTELVVISLPT